MILKLSSNLKNDPTPKIDLVIIYSLAFFQ